MSIDTGYMYTMQTQLDRSVDAAALAGAAALIEGTDAANESVIEYLVRNPVGKPNTITTNDELVQLTAQFLAEHAERLRNRVGRTGTPKRDSSRKPIQLPVRRSRFR